MLHVCAIMSTYYVSTYYMAPCCQRPVYGEMLRSPLELRLPKNTYSRQTTGCCCCRAVHPNPSPNPNQTTGCCCCRVVPSGRRARCHVEISRPEASATAPSCTPLQRQIKLRAASSLGLQPRPPASASLGQPRPIGRYLVWLAGYTGPAFLIGTLRLSYGRLVEPEETEDVAARLADGVRHLLAA